MYVIEHLFSHGWEASDCYEENGASYVTIYETKAEAQAELRDMFADAAAQGMDGYTKREWRIRKVTDSDPVEMTFSVRIQCGSWVREVLVRSTSAERAINDLMKGGEGGMIQPTTEQRSAWFRMKAKCPTWRIVEQSY